MLRVEARLVVLKRKRLFFVREPLLGGGKRVVLYRSNKQLGTTSISIGMEKRIEKLYLITYLNTPPPKVVSLGAGVAQKGRPGGGCCGPRWSTPTRHRKKRKRRKKEMIKYQ